MNDDVEIIGGSEKVPIVIAEYDPRWPARYAESSAAISAALGRRALRLEHIGSTAVPGLGAKPIVDILVVVADSADEASYLPHLERAGYALRVREPGLDEHRMLRSPARDVHVHVYSQGSREIERYCCSATCCARTRGRGLCTKARSGGCRRRSGTAWTTTPRRRPRRSRRSSRRHAWPAFRGDLTAPTRTSSDVCAWCLRA